MKTSLTVFFEDPFWVGVFERIEDGKLSVCKVTFGAEPTDGELYDFILREYTHLRFSPAVEADVHRAPTIRSGGSGMRAGSSKNRASARNRSRRCKNNTKK